MKELAEIEGGLLVIAEGVEIWQAVLVLSGEGDRILLAFIGQFNVKEGMVADILVAKHNILKYSAKIDILLEPVLNDMTLINLRSLCILHLRFDIADDTDFMGLEQIDILISVGLSVILMQRGI